MKVNEAVNGMFELLLCVCHMNEDNRELRIYVKPLLFVYSVFTSK